MSDPLPTDMREAIDQCQRACEAIVDTFAQGLKHDPLRQYIYHYTDGAGFRGILETGKLWLTDVSSLDDPSELRYGFESAIKLIEDEGNRGPLEVKLFADELISILRGGIEEIAFVCCFSRADDDLGQWRAYADNGRGFAIGFDAHMLDQSFARRSGDPIPRCITFPLTYGNDRLREMYQQITGIIIPVVSAVRGRDLSNDAIRDYLIALAHSVSVPIVRAALFFKHKAYSNEEEYRFLQLHQAGPVRNLKFRGRPYSLIRYQELDWRSASPEVLRRIVIGPAADESVALQFARDCRRAFHGPSPVITKVSEIPYRAP